MKEFVSGASVRLAELEDLFVDMKARVRFYNPNKCLPKMKITTFYLFVL